MNDALDMVGEYTLEVIRDGKNGPEVIDRRVAKNLIMNTGKKLLWRLCVGYTTSPLQAASAKRFNHMRLGSGSAAATSGGTNLQTPVTGTLKTFDSATLLAGTRTMQMVRSYPSGGGSKSATFKEVCILGSKTSPGGTALSRAVFAAVTKTTADKFRITYKCRIT